MNGPDIPIHAARALHSGLVDEVLTSPPDECLAINNRLCGLGWDSFVAALHDGTLRIRVTPVGIEDAWISLEYAAQPGTYRTLVSMAARILGVDAQALLRDHAASLGLTLEQLAKEIG